ncbi:matrix remodeling-associated protein 8-like [Megalobrama amblycephala]|uniref:matrix remodeling-associated protein 8-like n=1 Tax=Megalobrama amblycephala TaxID=75352 RepID=UPI00201410E5|nr:matrix remodeling-associated protein 8-like [Megalobrama amblycephala]
MMGSFQPSNLQLLFVLIAALDCNVATQRPCKQVHRLNINYVQGDNMSISCLTTTHPLESLTVKLRRTDPIKDILMYSDTSPASEHQRWSVRNDSGNVTLYLKDISLSDQGRYECEVYKDLDCLNATVLNLRVRECKTLDSVHATPDSSVLLPCSEHPLQNRTDQATWKIFHGHQSTEIAQYRPPNKPSNSTERDTRPLYERARILGNGSLFIRDAVNTDGSWYQCRVSEKTCYEVKLVMKVITDAPTPADSPAAVTINLIAVVMITIVSLSVFITLIVGATLYFKKGRIKINSQIELDCWSSVSYSGVSGEFDVPFNSLVL